jgi:hypothetical protein
MLSNLLEKFNIKYEDLNAAEKETLDTWYKALASRQITTSDIQDFIKRLIEAVERELADVKESTSFWSFLFRRKQDIFLKARLKNYLMIHDFLLGPEKARKHIEQSLQNIRSGLINRRATILAWHDAKN